MRDFPLLAYVQLYWKDAQSQHRCSWRGRLWLAWMSCNIILLSFLTTRTVQETWKLQPRDLREVKFTQQQDDKKSLQKFFSGGPAQQSLTVLLFVGGTESKCRGWVPPTKVWVPHKPTPGLLANHKSDPAPWPRLSSGF